MLDIYHTVIDFDAHSLRRFVTHRVVLERTDDPGPTASERRVISARRAKEERARQGGWPRQGEGTAPSRRRRAKPRPRGRAGDSDGARRPTHPPETRPQPAAPNGPPSAGRPAIQRAVTPRA